MSAGDDVWGDRASEGPPRPFFNSRWTTPAPAHVRELDPATAGLPQGFRAAGVACGIKPSGNHDLGILVCDGPQAVSAARFTATATPAAPVLLSRERCRLHGLRAVLANSGCANAETGQRGLDDAAKTQGAAAIALGVSPEEVVLGSTGGISWYLPVDAALRGILDASSRLRREGDGEFQQAIQTTDAFEKRASVQVELPSGTVRLSAQCKGAGMISPQFATMLCFVQTDASLEPQTADLLLGVCVKRSFDRCSVDGQLSTNDTAVLMCSGASGVRVLPESEDELRLGEALDALLRALAIMMVADGEGAQRIARVVVRGGHAEGVETVARGVANSTLVKTALHGADPNWGRLIQSTGAALAGRDWWPVPLIMDLSIQGMLVCSASAPTDYDSGALAQAVREREIEYEITLPGSGCEAEMFFSDLGHEYIRINAEYTT